MTFDFSFEGSEIYTTEADSFNDALITIKEKASDKPLDFLWCDKNDECADDDRLKSLNQFLGLEV